MYAFPLTVLAALEVLAVLLLQGQLGLQLGGASLGQLAAQLLVLLDQHAALSHQLLPRLAARDTGWTSQSSRTRHSERGSPSASQQRSR